MSKIGKKPIIIPENIEINIDGNLISAKGPKGEQSLKIHPRVDIEKKENQIIVSIKSNSKYIRAMHGLYRNLIANVIIGVEKGFSKQLQLQGLGYRATLASEGDKQKLTLFLGFSHSIDFPAPAGIKFNVQKNIITIEGIDKQLVGETAAKIRALRPPEPYKGKGVRYIDEIVKRKQGKQVAKTEKTGA